MVLHCDDDELSVIALGEPAGPEDDAHLQQCPRCRSRLDQLTAVIGSARAITDADRPADPPPAVWAAIEAELGTGDRVTAIGSARSTRRPRVWILAAAAACVGLVLGGVVTAAVSYEPTSADVVARADLAPVDDSGFAGTATVERSADGAVLHVTVGALPPVSDGYYEVWMATPDTTTMVAIGTLGARGDAVFPLPAGMDADQFPVVDVSVEHFDGDPGHSAVSVVRGQLAT